jgi:hypothetical protein
VRKLGKFWPMFLGLAALLLVLAVACGDGEEEETPAGTPAATVTGTPTAVAEVPGITDTDILLGVDVPLSGALGAVYATIPQATEAYFEYINDTQGGVCGRKIVYKVEDNNDDPAVAEHYRIMDEYGGPSPTNFTVYAQTLAEVAVEALSRTCDNLTREDLMDALESIEGFHSDLFIDEVNISFSDTDHRGLEDGRLLRAVVEDGKGRWEYFGPLLVFEEQELE